MITYARSHWRGEQSLERSYWINGVLVGIPLRILSSLLAHAEPSAADIATYASLFSIYVLLTIFWVPWFAIGTIRSARNHIRRTGRRFWAWVAQIIAGLNLIAMPILIFGGSVVAWSLVMAAMGRDDISPAEVFVNDNGLIVINGHIDFETPDQFEAVLSENPDTKIIQLESFGGYMEPAKRIADKIADESLDTYTSVECDSACTILFIAGNNRYIDYDGMMGFHSAGLDGLPDKVVSEIGIRQDMFLTSKGVQQWFIDRIYDTSSDDMWYPTMDELVSAKIITHIYDYEDDTTYTAPDYCQQLDCQQPHPLTAATEE